MLVQHDDVECFQTTTGKWNETRMGVGLRNSEGPQEECRASHMISADNCHLFAAPKSEIKKMIADTTEELRKRGRDWKEDQMELIAWSFDVKKRRSPY